MIILHYLSLSFSVFNFSPPSLSLCLYVSHSFFLSAFVCISPFAVIQISGKSRKTKTGYKPLM